MDTERRALAWDHGCLAVQSLGGMLGPVLFLLPDGRQISPLHVAPWGMDEARATLPGVLRELRGEWPCVPFGTDAARDLRAAWAAGGATFDGAGTPHGFSSNEHWRFVDAPPGSVEIAIAYPDDHPVQGLRRRITPDPVAPAIDIELEVRVRRPCRLPMGLHPVFRLSPSAGSLRLDPGRYDHVRTFPGVIEPDAALFPADRRFARLDQAPTRSGGLVDATRLPLQADVEELLQLIGVDGSMALHYPEDGYSARLTWQAEHFPSLLLWFSNRGRAGYPWHGKHLAIGVEPVCSAFDLGPAISAGDNPIAQAGVATAIALVPDRPFVTQYRIAVE